MEVSGEIRTFAGGMLKCGRENMTPEEYMDKLKDAQRTLDRVKEDLDRAIYKMQQRAETGYKSFEQESRLAAMAGREYLGLVRSDIYETVTSEIEL